MWVKALQTLLGIVALSGCVAANYRAHPTLPDRAKDLKTITMLPPRIDVYQIGAGGVLEKIDEWSKQGTNNVIAGINGRLNQKSGLRLNIISSDELPKELEAEIEQTHALFDAVNDSILRHTYGPPVQRFEEKITNFDYSLGQEMQKLARGDDAVLLIRGIDHISSEGRIALQTTAMLVAAAFGVALIPRGGVTALSIALVDGKTGVVLWYIFARSEGGHDLRKPDSASSLVEQLLTEFPIP